MKIVSYNINGIRASIKNGLKDWLASFSADIYCFQEVRCQEDLTRELLFGTNQLSLFGENEPNPLSSYHAIYNCGSKPGYAGTMILSKRRPNKIIYGFDGEDPEGRTTTICFDKLAIVNVYIPNGGTRLDFKMQFLANFEAFIAKLKLNYKVILMGDFNIAHNEIDLTNPKECRNKSVFLPEERKAFSSLLSLGITDCFRYLYPNKIKYSWRSYKTQNIVGYAGWMYRIDYILCTNDLRDKLISCDILDKPFSDHLPVVLEIDI